METAGFGRLPYEVREVIYRHLLYEPLTIRFCMQEQNMQLAVIRSESSCAGEKPPSLSDCRPPLAVSLFAVCRTMRRDTLGLYFQMNCMTIYAAPHFDTTFDKFRLWLLSLTCCERGLVRSPRSVTIWLGHFYPYSDLRWSRIRAAIGTFLPNVLARLAIGFELPRMTSAHDYPESYEKFGWTEFTMFYTHLHDADRKLNQLRGQHLLVTPTALRWTHRVDGILALGYFIGRMPTFRRRGDISKPFEIGLPSDLDAVYDLELQERHRGEEGLQLYDFVAEKSLPRDGSNLYVCRGQKGTQAEKQACEQHVQQAVEQAVEQAVWQVVDQTLREPGPSMTRVAINRAIKGGSKEAIERVTRRVTFDTPGWPKKSSSVL